MKKVNKVMLILVATIINATTANTKLRNEVESYKSYYKSSEALFNEIEDFNENLFDTDKAVDYYNAKLPISKIKFCY